MGDHKPLSIKQESIVRSVSTKLPAYKGTVVAKEFINERLTRCQAHLERITIFLEHGQTWWKETDTGYMFHDSDSDPDVQPEGPTIMHFRSTKIPTVHTHAKETWRKIITNNITLPAPSIKLMMLTETTEGHRISQWHKWMTVHALQNTTRFQELTEEEYEAIAHTASQTPPATSNQLPSHSCTPQQAVSSLQPKTLFNVDLPVTTSARKTADVDPAEQTCDDQVLDVIVHCTVHSNDDNSTATTLQTKAGNLLLKVIGNGNTLTEFDFLRAKLKAKIRESPLIQRRKSMLHSWESCKKQSCLLGTQANRLSKSSKRTTTTRTMFSQTGPYQNTKNY